MSEKEHTVLKCAECGAIVEVLDECTCTGDCTFQCCGKPMIEMKEKTADMATEKHVPVATALPTGGTKVVVGSTPHPMTPEHYIEWIDVQTSQGFQHKVLNPGDKPQACFALCEGETVEAVYAYCNLHGLWKA